VIVGQWTRINAWCGQDVGVIDFAIFLKAHDTIPKSAEY